MTGEVTLRGRVLPVGGIKEKVLAAFRAGIREVILPEDNEKELEEIPREVRDEMRFDLVSHMDEVLEIALLGDLDASVTTSAGDGERTSSSPPLAH
jgi:ATP-dependent Lon protease